MRGNALLFVLSLCFFATLGVFWWAFEPQRVSQEVLDLFPHNDDKQIIEAYRYFSSSKYVPVAIKGFDKNAQKRMQELTHKIQSLPYVSSVIEQNVPLEKQLYAFLTQNTSYILPPHDTSLDSHTQTHSQDTPTSLEAQKIFAPLLHQLTNHFTSSNSLDTSTLAAKDYGLMALVELSSLEDKAIKSTLQSFKMLKQDYPDMRYFSSDFMRVENLELILNEVNFLLGFASFVFVLLYFVIIRIPLLTFYTICTLILSNAIAILLTLCIYPKVTIMVLSFGMGISNIAIDYMMHHHFFGLYTQSASSSKKSTHPRPPFNFPVFYGYFTTMVGFGACLFIPFPLLSQLALYAMISLSVAYINFAFIYPRIGFKPPRLFNAISALRKPCVPSIIFLGIAIIGFIYASTQLRLDFDLSKLDYQNKPMLEERAFFMHIQDKQRDDVLLFADKSDGLMLFVRGLIQSTGVITFRQSEGESHLEKYYYLASMSKAQIAKAHELLESLQSLPSDSKNTINPQELWNAQEQEEIVQSNVCIEARSIQSIMDNLADSIYQPMLIVLGIALCLMLLTLAFNTRRAFLSAASFVLFPLSIALCVISSHSVLNMMHLFALLILVVVSVDYGIYAIKEDDNPRTTHAIVFSALTTGLSFGILMISNTKALNSFGEVIFSGMSCIMLLLICGRFKVKDNKVVIESKP
ncbi:hypothetical protein OQH61_00985 [Helicobacter sp. MIT 21-1697]|uniref:hypothetical protein n=1 Tax=Helicobacter sp. MIT 21-1697 TaxID=2993733 RepID=UPI00224ACAD1|nr:hypothetical protein [Helicobacter sp. MIT 21-1697]MCX2716314.1 hypothetical protein [Helicobacter sp. MIT 21-1697]